MDGLSQKCINEVEPKQARRMPVQCFGLMKVGCCIGAWPGFRSGSARFVGKRLGFGAGSSPARAENMQQEIHGAQP
jgi:hypothetical protein